MEWHLLLFLAGCLLLELAVEQLKLWLRRWLILRYRKKLRSRLKPLPNALDTCGYSHTWGEWFGPYQSDYSWYYGRKCLKCPFVDAKYVRQEVAEGSLFISKHRVSHATLKPEDTLCARS